MPNLPTSKHSQDHPPELSPALPERAKPNTNQYSGTGEGSLLRTIGIAEYLDKLCLEKAKIRAMAMGDTRNRLSIRNLVLTGVVVDADPFIHWFDPKRLKCINFKDNCVDAGFYLAHCMRKVSVLFPKQLKEPVETFGTRRVEPLKELKVIELKGGKKVGEIPYRGKESLKEEIPRNVAIGGDSKGLSGAESRIDIERAQEKGKGRADNSQLGPEDDIGVAF